MSLDSESAMKRVSAVLLFMLMACAPSQRHSIRDPDFLLDREPKTQLMFLGVFHFANPGLDTYKPRFPFDAMSPLRQTEIATVVSRLLRYKPTMVAVEWEKADQNRLDSLYREYVKGAYSPGPNEVFQIGFRLARSLGHSRVYAIDAPARSLLTEDVAQREAKALGMNIDSVLTSEPWRKRYDQLYAFHDSLKTVMSLADYLIYINGSDEIRKGHGSYVVGSFKLARGNNYVGVDDMTQWYNRNLRIFSNLQQLSTRPDDRILVIIGAGHLPILDFLAASSPEHYLVDVRDLLAR